MKKGSMKKIILMSAAALTLSSCGIYKKYQPSTTVPDQLYGEELSAATDTASFGNLTWKEVFTDPYLQTLIDSALVRNTDMQTAHLKIKEAEAALLSARLAYVPSLNFTPQGTVSSFDGGKASQTYSIPVAASWEIDIFGKLTNAKRQALAGYEQTKEYAQAVKTQLVAGVANTYYTLLMLDAQYEIAVETETAWKASVETTRAMKEAGMVTEAALAQTEATYYSVCTTVHDLKEQINQAQNSLCLLLAETPRTIERGKLAGQQFPESFSVGIPLQMLSNRPDVRSAEYSLMQSFYATNAARSALYPSITLSGSAGWTNSAGSMIVNPGKLLLSAAGSLLQPIFNAGANRANLKIAKAQQEEAKLSFQQTLLNAGAEVNNALTQCQMARAKTDVRAKQIEAMERAVVSTELLMQHSSTTYLEVLTAQQSLLSAQLSQIADRFDEIQGIVNLYQALGGGRDLTTKEEK